MDLTLLSLSIKVFEFEFDFSLTLCSPLYLIAASGSMCVSLSPSLAFRVSVPTPSSDVISNHSVNHHLFAHGTPQEFSP